MKKLENDYLRITLYLSPTSKKGKEIYRFLNSMSRMKTEFVCNLILNFLRANNITNIDKLSKRDIRELVEISKDFNGTLNETPNISENALAGMILKFLSRNSNENTSVTKEILFPEQPKDSTGKFSKKKDSSDYTENNDSDDEESVSSESLAPNWQASLDMFNDDSYD